MKYEAVQKFCLQLFSQGNNLDLVDLLLILVKKEKQGWQGPCALCKARSKKEGICHCLKNYYSCGDMKFLDFMR